ncbi:MAG: hypothetical protein OXC57_14365 [Rhodobacteraceae bacterium]|nr:hypothetical protein [Paracoccaceae bacterium]
MDNKRNRESCHEKRALNTFAVSDGIMPADKVAEAIPEILTINVYARTQHVWVLGGALTTAVTMIDPDNLGKHELNNGDDDDLGSITAVLVEVYNAQDTNENDFQQIMIIWNSIANNATAMETEDLELDGIEGVNTAVPITVTGVTRERITVEVTADTDTCEEVRNGIGNASVYVGSANGS